jgi:serine/threonine-protein kinase RsbW
VDVVDGCGNPLRHMWADFVEGGDIKMTKKLTGETDLSSTAIQHMWHKPHEQKVGAMGQAHTIKSPSPRSSHQGGPSIRLEFSLRSEFTAISRFVDTLMQLIRKCRWVPGSEEDIEIALREALANAVIHGNHEDPGKQVYLGCRGGTGQVSIVVRDEGEGFDIDEVPDPTAPENIESSHGRGIYLMKTLMDEVRFERGGAVVYMRKSTGKSSS